MPSKKTVPKKTPAKRGPEAGKPKITMAELPRKTLEECLAIARPIHEVYAGRSASWDELATAAGVGARSTVTKYLVWSAQAYDLLIRNGENYELSETARKIIAPNFPDERAEGVLKAATIPTVFSKFYTDYNGKLLPEDDFLNNVLENRYQVPRDRIDEAKAILLANAVFAGILTEHPNGKRILRLGAGQPGANDDGIAAVTPSSVTATPTEAPASTRGSSETLCFYITPIGDETSEVRKHADMLLKHLVEPAFAEFKIKVIRADKIEKSGLISQQIFEHIVSTRFCVADLSFGNPNAFYELGVRHMTKLPTIQLIRKGDKIPFDVSQGRTITVDMSDIYTILDKMESARRELTEHIRNYLEPGENLKADDNPVSIYLPTLQIKLPRPPE